MPLQNGDFVLVDYVVRVKETNEIIDSTIESVAKKEKIIRKNGVYEPILVVLGEGWILKPVEEELLNLDVGQSRIIEVPPLKAFGERDSKKIKIISARELSKKGITPRVGERVELNNEVGIIRSVSGGRVTVDFNHPLAGKTLIYEITVLKKIQNIPDKVCEIVKRHIRTVDKNLVKIEHIEKTIKIELPESVRVIDGIEYAKRGIVKDIFKTMIDIDSVIFVETYRKS
ncbi:MAG: FKBP-type peptidyl-prolyl cis-trans isomerase [Candidatus Methanomethylicia archaeon]